MNNSYKSSSLYVERLQNKAEESRRVSIFLTLVLFLVLYYLNIMPYEMFLIGFTSHLLLAALFIKGVPIKLRTIAMHVIIGLLLPLAAIFHPEYLTICQLGSLFGLFSSVSQNGEVATHYLHAFYAQIILSTAAWVVFWLSAALNTNQSYFDRLGASNPIMSELFQFWIIYLIALIYSVMNIKNRRMLEISASESFGKLELANEKLAQKNKAQRSEIDEKESFILRFSHEIRNPLNSLLGNLELVLDLVEEGDAKEMIKRAKICGQILTQLINNILDSAKADSAKLEVSLAPTDIRDLLERVWTVNSELIRMKNLYGALHVNYQVPTCLKMDPHRFSTLR